MPSKKKRVASRQAQLSQRRRRERNRGRREDPGPGPALVPRAMPADAGAQRDASEANDAVVPAPASEPSIASSAVEQPALSREQGRARRRRGAARTEPVPTYTHLRGELRHIGIVTAVIVALLTVLTVLLR